MSDPWLTILHGDCRAMMAGLPAESVHMCVTSPPYWSLRDYGTAVWVGGSDPECAHKRHVKPRQDRPNPSGSGIGKGGAYFDAQSDAEAMYRDVCGLCGAQRIEPTVWGGEVLHEHAWGADLIRVGGSQAQGATSQRVGRSNTEEQVATGGSMGAFCSCGAWRGALGLEPTPELYVEHIVEVFRAVRRILRSDGTLWLNLGDSYAAQRSGTAMPAETIAGHLRDQPTQGRQGHRDARAIGMKHKDLVGIPWMVAFALRADGWWLRRDIIWSKPNPMPESVEDRPTSAHEYLFLLAKSDRYFYDSAAVREVSVDPSQARWDPGDNGLESSVSHAGTNRSTRRFGAGVAPSKQELTAESAESAGGSSGRRMGGFNARWDAREAAAPLGRNRRSVWEIATHPYKEAHFATYPPKLVEPCVLAGTSARGVCAECGAPWVRVEDETEDERPDFRHSTFDAGKTALHQPDPAPGARYVKVTVGWRPTCEHMPRSDEWLEYPPRLREESAAVYAARIEPYRRHRAKLLGLWMQESAVPAVVLDPFAGSGTTGLVAQQLSRRAVLIDLNDEYLEQLATRTQQQPLGLAVG